MRIAALETIPVGLPFARTYVTASGRLDSREMLIVRLAADDGAIGWGDAVPMSLRGGPGLDSVRADIEDRCAAALIGLDYEADRDRFIAAALDRCRLAGAGRQALSAVDVALVDLIGKHEGEPAWRVLGAAAGGPVACNATIGADSPDQAAAAAAAAVRGGFGTVKVKAGDERDVERIRAVRGAAGAGMRLRIDANGAWTAAEAVRRLGELESLDLELAEQPCPTAPELAEVRSATGVPIVADESVNDLDEAARGAGDRRLRCRDPEARQGRWPPRGARDRRGGTRVPVERARQRTRDRRRGSHRPGDASAPVRFRARARPGDLAPVRGQCRR